MLGSHDDRLASVSRRWRLSPNQGVGTIGAWLYEESIRAKNSGAVQGRKAKCGRSVCFELRAYCVLVRGQRLG